MVFNAFVFLQVFNQINCRRIQPNEFNVFANIHRDTGFLWVQAVIVFAQWLIVSYGGVAFSTVPLTGPQWAGTLFIGMLSLPVGLFFRMLPDLSTCFGLESANSAAQQHRPEVSTARMHMESSVRDVQHAVRFFSAIRNSQLARMHDEAMAANAAAAGSSSFDPAGRSNNFLGDVSPPDESTAASTAAVSTTSSWARVRRAMDKAPM
ncbi:plasma membrane calcium [Coemansia nantahalensis]|nr:plasma membrane calcium [Coemansia nantahalensis]